MRASVGERRSRPGGRSARIRDAVLAAALVDLVEVGLDGMSVDAVARRAGVHRATVYRRWGDVGGLLADALAAARDDEWAPADTGSLEGDLKALNREVLEAFTTEPSVSSAVIAAAFRSEQAAAALRAFWADRYERSSLVVARAIQRGEISADTDSRRLLIASTAPLYHRLVLMREPVTVPDADAAAASAVIAARAGAYGSVPA